MATKQINTGQWSKDQVGQLQKATLNLDLSQFKTGNSITGTIGDIHVTGRTCDRWEDDGMTHYWNTAAMMCGVTSNGSLMDSYQQLSNRYNIWADSPFDQTFNGLPIKVGDNLGLIVHDSLAYFGPTLTDGSYTDWNIDTTVSISYEILAERPINLKQRGVNIYEPIYVDFSLTSNNSVSYDIIVNERTIISSETSNKYVEIPHGTILSTSDKVKVNIKSKLQFMGDIYYSEVVSLNLSGFQTLIAEKPSNLRVLGDSRDIYEPITFAWDTLDDRCTSLIEVWQDGVIVISKSKITGKQYVLPAGTLKNTNDIKIRLNNNLSINGYSHTSDYIELQVNKLTATKPVINDFTLSSKNRDYDIVVSVESENSTSFKLFYDGSEIASSSTSEFTIQKGTLRKGNVSLTLKSYKTSSAGELVGELTKQFDIIQDEPLIYSIEPSNININVEETSTVSFNTNTFVSRWELHVNNSLFRSGTVEREISVGAGTFRTGLNSLKVQVYYSPSYDPSEIRTAIKTVTFTGYGRPKDPVHDGKYVYDTATPTFTWTTGTGENDSQTAFEIEVNDEKKLVNGSTKEYTVSEPLSDDERYTVRLRIKNKFEMWSNWVEKEFETSFSDLPKPVITVSPQLENVLIEVQADELAGLTKVSVFRSNDAKKWVELANDLNPVDTLIDFMVQSNVKTYYKVRVYDSSGGFNESEIKSITVNIRNYNILDVRDLRSNKRLDFATINFTNNFTSVTKIFSNSTRPIFYKGNTSFYTASMTVKLENKDVESFIDYIKKGDIFCYRDYRGKKLFVAIDLISINYINPFLQELVLNLTEVNFNETLSGNKANYTTFVYLDGQYYLNGSIDLSAWGGDL